MDTLSTISTRHTPQSEQADPRQKPNSAGGWGFQVSDEVRVHRFLTIGVDGGTYYATDRALAKDNAEVIIRAARERGEWLTEQIVAVSTAGRAPKQNPAIFALAACSALADDAGRRAALDAVPLVCRTGTHLFLFAGYVEQFRGWGRGLRRAVAAWYTDRDVDALAYQAAKYRQRQGWSHGDLLRLAHPETGEPARRALFEWTLRGEVSDDLPPLVSAFIEAQTATSVATWARLIEAHGLSWEMLPDAALSKPAVWAALIEKGMPQTALIRQLPRLTRLGVLTGATLRTVCAQLGDQERLRKGKVHPVNVLVALRTYAAGQSARGQSEWQPNGKVIDALDTAFYAAFGTIEPANKRTLVALDVSGSMTQPASGLPVSCREASAAVGLVTMATEPDTTVVGFTSGALSGRSSAITELPISPRQRLDDAVRAVSNLPFGGTDCALPMTWALEQGREFDQFLVVTDNETWAGSMHPHQALRRYQQQVNPAAKLVVCGMTASDVSIADPEDPSTLDVAGFDSATPQLITDFARGDV